MSTSDYLILVGSPNSGKTTLFNWITGYKRQTVNYPGSTVDLFFGSVRKSKQVGFNWNIVDTPGVYHLFQAIKKQAGDSIEAEVVRKILKDSASDGALRGVILVLDATRLLRQLPLAFQLKSQGVPFVIALSMYDIQKRKQSLNLDLLSKHLKVPVCPIEGLLGGGVLSLLKTAKEYLKNKPILKALDFKASHWSESSQEELLKQAHNIVTDIKKPVLEDTNLKQPISILNKNNTDNYNDIKKPKRDAIGWKTRKIDTWLLHPVFGFGFLSMILFSFFSGLFWLAQPLMDLIDRGFSVAIEWLLIKAPDLMVMDFLANGIVSGFGAFFVFVPQVFILFLGIHLLEDSGYLARAVSLVDGPFSRIGLSGKSLIPFLSGFACAIPAVLSARTIVNKKERWITTFVIPLMTCSARLPVYALLLGFLFYKEPAWKPGVFMAGLYFLSLLLAVGGAGILNAFTKKQNKSTFLMELPLYRTPVWSNVLALSWSRTKHFIWKAGPVIVMFALVMWGAVNFPSHPELKPSQQIQNSYAGRFGQWIEPVFENMGADWRVGVSLLSAFVAREVFVSVLAVVLKNTQENTQNDNITNNTLDNTLNTPDNITQKKSLVQTMKQTRTLNGRWLFSTKGVIALLIFFMFSLQCLSTTGVVYKETGSWKFAGLQLIVLNALGYLGAVCSFQLLPL